MENLRQVLYNFHRCNNNSTQFNQEMEKTTNTTECQGENTFYENTFFQVFANNSAQSLPS